MTSVNAKLHLVLLFCYFLSPHYFLKGRSTKFLKWINITLNENHFLKNLCIFHLLSRCAVLMSISIMQRVCRGILLRRDFQLWPEGYIACMSASVRSSWFCFSFICFSFNCFSFISLQITVSSGGMLVQKLNVSDLQSENGPFDGTMVYAQNKVQSMGLKTKPSLSLLASSYHLLCRKPVGHCCFPIASNP